MWASLVSVVNASISPPTASPYFYKPQYKIAEILHTSYISRMDFNRNMPSVSVTTEAQDVVNTASAAMS